MLSIVSNEPSSASANSQRINVINQAVWEMDALARVLPDLIPLTEDQAHYVARGICGRMLRLTSAIMCALDDSESDIDKVMARLKLVGAQQG